MQQNKLDEKCDVPGTNGRGGLSECLRNSHIIHPFNIGETGRDLGLCATFASVSFTGWIILYGKDIIDFHFFIIICYFIQILCCLLDREYIVCQQDVRPSFLPCLVVPYYLFYRNRFLNLTGFNRVANVILWITSLMWCLF